MLKKSRRKRRLNKYKTYTNHSLTWFHVKENRGQQTANINTDKIGKTTSYPSHVKAHTHPTASRQNPRRKFSRAEGPAELSKGESYHPAEGRVELF